MRPVALVGVCKKCGGKGFLDLQGQRWRARCEQCQRTSGWLSASTAAIWAWDAGEVKDEEAPP